MQNSISKFMIRAIDPSKTDTSFLLLISNFRRTETNDFLQSFFAKGCPPEVLRRIYRHCGFSTGTITNNHILKNGKVK